MLTTRVIDRLAAADALAPAWRELLSRASYSAPVRTPLWALSWWRVFGDVGGRRMRIVTVHDGDTLVGLAPLLWRVALHRRAVPVRRIEPIGTGEDEADEICSDYVGVIAARDREGDVARAVARAIASGALGGWDELVMPALPADDAMVEAFRAALARSGVAPTIEPFGACPYVALPASWDAYLKALAAEDRYLVTRSLRELEKWAGAGGFALHVARTPDELAEGRRILRSLHGERWASRGHAGVFVSPRFTRFHDLVMPKLLARDPSRADGQLELAWLTVHGRPVAAAYNIVYDGRVQFYQSGRALDVPRKVRPGIALHALAIRASIDAGRREYDFLNGDAQYKTQLATATRGLVLLRARGASPRARAVDAAMAAVERAVALARRVRGRVTGRAAGKASDVPSAGEASAGADR